MAENAEPPTGPIAEVPGVDHAVTAATLRDWFAIAALPALIARADMPDGKECSDAAYMWADLMLVSRGAK